MTLDRRQFVTALLASGAAAAVPAPTIDGNLPSFSPATSLANPPDTKVDFRYARTTSNPPSVFQTMPERPSLAKLATCDTDSPSRSGPAWENFATVVEFSLVGFQDNKILRQRIESPAVPIVHTLIDLPAATFELIAFTTRHAGEGRVDNVLLSIKSKSGRVAVVPKIQFPRLLLSCAATSRGDLLPCARTVAVGTV